MLLLLWGRWAIVLWLVGSVVLLGSIEELVLILVLVLVRVRQIEAMVVLLVLLDVGENVGLLNGSQQLAASGELLHGSLMVVMVMVVWLLKRV